MTNTEYEELTSKLIEEYGEDHRALIMDALLWLQDSEPNWNLEQPMNREEFLRELLNKAKKDSHQIAEIQEKADALEETS